MFTKLVSSALGLIWHFHAALEDRSSNLGLEHSTDTTFPDEMTLRESREAWERDLDRRPKALPTHGKGNLQAGLGWGIDG